MIGHCHLCSKVQMVEFCRLCNHWFCENCRRDYAGRAFEFLKALSGKTKPGCCGPAMEAYGHG